MRRDRPPEDPSVDPVERILGAAASRTIAEPPRRGGRLVASRAIWLCACESLYTSPAWLVYTVDADGVGWQRIPSRTSVSDLVDAEHLTGCHLAPEDVLAWLLGERSRLRDELAEFPEDASICDELQRRICQ